MNKILQVNNVTKYYGNGSVVTKALDNVTFSVDKGSFTAIMGASGSGKSTLLNIISTIDRASSGTILIDDKDIMEMNENQLSAFRRDKLGFIFQEYNLLDTLTIGENIILPLNLKHMDYESTKKELEEISQALGVDDQINKFPYELSGGQRQRAACARAIITKPALVLADEATGALDSANSRNLMKTFDMMNRHLATTILMVTHDAAVGSWADRVLFLKDGQIWSELVRGKRERREMYSEILSVSSALGGEGDVH